MRAARLSIALLVLMAACGPPPAAHLPPAPSQLFLEAEAAFSRGDYQPAVEAYSRFLNESPPDAYVARAYFQLAMAQYRLHQYGAVLTTLDDLKHHDPKQQSVQALALRGDAELALGHRVQALLDWEEAWVGATPVEQPHLRERIEPLARQMTEDERLQANQSVTVPAVREMAGLSQSPAVAAMPAGEIPDAPAAEASPGAPAPLTGEETTAVLEPSAPAATEEEAKTEKAPAAPIPEAEVAAVAAPPEQAEPGEPETAAADIGEPTTKVACLLPLTGPDHAYGQRALAGLRLAFADTPEQLVVRDTGGDPSIAQELMTSLDRDPSVVAVIGPLRSSEAEVSAPLAEREQLPLLLLSQREGLTGHYVLQMAMTRSQQVRLLVGYAIDTLKLQHFGVLYPNDGYGASFNRLFTEVVNGHGGQLVGSQAYKPGDPDVGRIAAVAQHWRSSGVQAVFVPDAANAATAVAAQVRHEIPEITLLGTESWNNSAALAKAGTSVEGAVFADAFFADSARASTRQFVERFERGAGRPPTVFEAEAFDAGMAVRHVIAQGATTRDQVITQLEGLGSLEGAGELRSSPTGFQRALSLLRYKEGKVEEITPGADG